MHVNEVVLALAVMVYSIALISFFVKNMSGIDLWSTGCIYERQNVT